jgi:hypothetical protein
MREWLLYLPEYKVLICRHCKHSIKPESGLARPLQYLHKSLPRPFRKVLVQYALGLPLVYPEAVPIPSAESASIEGLSVWDGWACDECEHVCKSEGSMREHCRGKNKWTKAEGTRWLERKRQTFFISDKRKYFIVTPSAVETVVTGASSVRLDGFIDALLKEANKKDVKEDERLGTVDASQYMVDKSPWMRCTGWLREFAGRDMNVIVERSRKQTKNQVEFQALWLGCNTTGLLEYTAL